MHNYSLFLCVCVVREELYRCWWLGTHVWRLEGLQVLALRISSLYPDTRFLTGICRPPVSLGEWALRMPATTPGFSCGFWDSNSVPHSVSSQFHWAATKPTRGSSSLFSLPILETAVLLASWPLLHFQSWYHRLCLYSVSLNLLLPSYKHLSNLE